MSRLRSSRNLLVPPTLIRAVNSEVRPSGLDPGTLSNSTPNIAIHREGAAKNLLVGLH